MPVITQRPAATRPMRFGSSASLSAHRKAGSPLRFGKNSPYTTGPKDPLAKARKQQVRQLRRNRLPSIIGLLLMGLSGLSGTATLASNMDNNGAKQDLIEQMQADTDAVETAVTSQNNPELTQAGNEFFLKKSNTPALTNDSLAEIDEAYSRMIIQLAESTDTQLQERDLEKRISVLQEKRPLVLALFKQLSDRGELDNPEKVFTGLTEIFREDMTPDEYKKIAVMQNEGFVLDQTGLDALADTGLGFGLYMISLMVGISFTRAGLKLSIDYKRAKAALKNSPPGRQ